MLGISPLMHSFIHYTHYILFFPPSFYPLSSYIPLFKSDTATACCCCNYYLSLKQRPHEGGGSWGEMHASGRGAGATCGRPDDVDVK